MATKKVTPPKATGLTDAQILNALKVNHPQWAQWIIQNPELKKVIIAWAKIPGGPTQEQIDAAVYPTNLVQEYNANQQNLDRLKALSPGEYASRKTQAQTDINDFFVKSGITPDDATKTAIFNQHFYQGLPLNDPRITQELGSKYKATSITGTSATLTSDLTNLSNQYMIPMDSKTLQDWGTKIASGLVTEADFENTLKTHASGLYPFMAGSINAIKPDQYFSPLKSMIQQNLEVDPASVNFNDPSGKWMNLALAKDPKTGENVARTLSDSIKEMRSNPIYGYDNTQGAKDSAFAIGSQIRSMMGYGA